MSSNRSYEIESFLAGFLKNGTLLAAAIIGAGLVLNFLVSSEETLIGVLLVRVGIALFILLPILRVAFMLVIFVRKRDRYFSIIAASVLLIILVSFAVGMSMAEASTILKAAS